METARSQSGQCSVQLRLQQCDSAGCGTVAQATNGAPAEPYRAESPALSHDACNDLTVTVKVECDEDADNCQELSVHHAHLREGSMTEAGSLSKKRDDFITNTKEETEKVMVKQELDIGLTVLQARTTACQFTPSILSNPLEPHPKADLEGDAALASSYSVSYRSHQPLHTELEVDYSRRDSGVPCDLSFVLNGADDAYHKGSRRRSFDHSGDDQASTTAERGASCRCVRIPIESDCRTDSSKTVAVVRADRKQKDCKFCMNNRIQKLNLMKRKHTTLKHFHIKQKIKIKRYKCRTSQVGSLKMRTHVAENPFKCGQCEYSTTRMVNLKVHTRTHADEKTYRCEHCEYITSKLNHLNRHMPTHTGVKPYKCDECEYSTYRKGNLQAHIRTHAGIKPYKCERCECSTSRMGNSKERMRGRTDESTCKCEKHEYSAFHLSTSKANTREKPYACKKCNYTTHHLGHLKVHMCIHTGEKPYKCEECGYGTSQLSTLRVHMRTHTGDKPYKCEVCEYSASRLCNLKVHMRTHTGEKPYKCEECGYSASHLSHLKCHMRIHTGEKPFSCRECDYSTSNPGSLNRHMRVHASGNRRSMKNVNAVHVE